jgi:uncharacterized protein (TIGR02147 family)
LSKVDRLRAFLADEFVERQRANPRYSLRAFARDLTLSPSLVSQMLRAQKPVTHETGRVLKRRLRLPPHRAALLSVLLADSEAASESSETAADLGAELPHPIREDVFQAVRRWHYGAIVCLSDLPDFDPSPAAIGRRLGISALEAEVAVDRLLRLGLLTRTEDGALRKSHPSFRAEDVPSKAKRQFQSEMLQRVTNALEEISPEERHVTGVLVAGNRAALEGARARVEAFCYEMREQLKTGGPSDEVFYVSVGIIPVTVPTGATRRRSSAPTPRRRPHV